jgi:drug/metabolite transporter (DMT)-like permease
MNYAPIAPFLMLISGFLHAVVNAILKSGRDKISGRALIDGFSALLVLPLAFYVPLPAGAWVWIFASWAVHLVYLIALIKAFESLDMSVAYPIARGIAPILASAGAVLIFHEPITRATIVGILLVSSGVALIGLHRGLNRRALAWSGLTGVCVALYTVIDAQGVRAAPSALSYIVWIFLILGLGIAFMFAAWRGRAFLAAAAHQWKPGLAAGSLSILTYGLALLALRLGATPALSALRETSILFAAVIAVVFLKERARPLRIGGAMLIAVGAIRLLAAS